MKRAVVAVVAAVLLTVTGCTGLQGTEGKDFVTGDGRVVPIAPADRDDPVESSGTTIAGTPLDVADYRGQVLVVNVWGSWCGPCRKEMPTLADVTSRLPSGAAIIGINTRDTDVNAAGLVRTTGVTFPSLSDPAGTALLAFSSELGIPSTMVLDRQGRLARIILGTIPSERTLLEVVDDVLGEPTGAA